MKEYLLDFLLPPWLVSACRLRGCMQITVVLLALRTLCDVYRVHSDSSVIVIYVSVLLPLATGFILTWQV